MIKNYLVTALRNLWKQYIYTAINVIGLSIGIGCAALIFFFVRSELTYDMFHPAHDRIYRIATGVNFRGLEYWAMTPYPLATTIKSETPGVERVTRLSKAADKTVRHGDDTFDEDVYLADASFFEIFHFPLISGNPEQIMDDPNGLIISTPLKERLFADVDPVGRTLSIQLRGQVFTDFIIAGVAAPIPENSSIRFDLMISNLHYPDVFGAWAVSGWYPKSPTMTFVRTAPDVSAETLNKNLNLIAAAHDIGKTKLGTADIDRKLLAQPVRDIHFNTSIKFTSTLLSPPGDLSYAYILSGIALFILAIACINFMNLAVGLSTRRTREVGLRKVFGADRLQLMKQFWTESVILSILALVIGLGVVELLLPTFNELTGKELDPAYLTDPVTFVLLVVLAILVGLTAGAYPAFILSGHRPVKIFSGAATTGGRHVFFKAMVVLQFGLSILLMTCTMVMNRQLNHMTNFDLGMNPDGVIYQRMPKGMDDQARERYRQEALRHPGVINAASGSATLFGDAPGGMWEVVYRGEKTSFPVFKVSYDFLDVMEIPLVAGRNLSRDRPADQVDRIIVNERFVEQFGLTDPIDKPMAFEGAIKPVVIGVAKDFHFLSLRHEVMPMAMFLMADDGGAQQMLFKLAPGTPYADTIDFLRAAWAKQTSVPFEYALLSESLRSQYRSEESFQRIMTTAAYFGIVIACLGLFGMTSLSVTRRTREMGVRKVMGASSLDIITLFNREYAGLIVAANVLAWPVAFLLMRTWLENFMVRVDLGPTLFMTAGLLALALAVLVVSAQALRAVRSDPAVTLRYE